MRTRSGWSLYVPAYVMQRNGGGTITSLGHGRVDIHISGPWRGPVLVTAPLHGRRDIVAHELGGVWVPESSRRGQRSVWVTQLSPLSLGSLLGKAQDALCLSIFVGDVPGFVECLARYGVAYVSGKVISWAFSKVSSSCAASLLANGIAAGTSKKVPLALLKGVLLNSACRGAASSPGGTGSAPLPTTGNPQPPTVNPQPPTVNPQAPSGAAHPVFTVMNTSETPPDGVWFRNSPHVADTDRVTGHGVYMNEQVRLDCYGAGDPVGPYNNSLWYYVEDITRPTNNGVPNNGWLNAHYINDGLVTNQVDPGVVPC